MLYSATQAPMVSERSILVYLSTLEISSIGGFLFLHLKIIRQISHAITHIASEQPATYKKTVPGSVDACCPIILLIRSPSNNISINNTNQGINETQLAIPMEKCFFALFQRLRGNFLIELYIFCALSCTSLAVLMASANSLPR